MPDGLYERGTLARSERQVGLLHCIAAYEQLNGAVVRPNVIDGIAGHSKVDDLLAKLAGGGAP